MGHGTHFWVLKLDCKSMVTFRFFFPKDLGALFGLVSYPGPWSESWRILFWEVPKKPTKPFCDFVKLWFFVASSTLVTDF